MAYVEFSGLATSDYGSDFSGLTSVVPEGVGSQTAGAVYNAQGEQEYFYVGLITFASDSSEQSNQFYFAYDGLGHSWVTKIVVNGWDGASMAPIMTISGLQIKVDVDWTNVPSAQNKAALNNATLKALSGDDNFTLTGPCSAFWGDFETATFAGSVTFGNDNFYEPGTITAISLAVGSPALTIYGDGKEVTVGALSYAGDDRIMLSRVNIPTIMYGDFMSVAGKIIFGNDTLIGGNAIDTLYGDAAATNLAKGGNDFLHGGAGADELHGGGGNDSLAPGPDTDADTLDGGKGFDTVFYFGSGGTMIVDLMNPASNTGEAINDTFISIEAIKGRLGDDDLRGSNAGNSFFGMGGIDTLTGRGGNDKLYGGEGNDIIEGDLGNDRLAGGTGADFFVFDTKLGSNNIDVIVDFVSGEDVIDLYATAFSSLTAGFGLPASRFRINTTGLAQDSNDYIIYESDTGKLYYDMDGAGGADAILFAKLSGHPALVASDFQIL